MGAVGGKMHLFIRYAMTHVLQIATDVVHIRVAKKNASEVFLTDGGHAFGVGEELYFKYFCLQVVHEPGDKQQEVLPPKGHLTSSLNHEGVNYWRVIAVL